MRLHQSLSFLKKITSKTILSLLITSFFINSCIKKPEKNLIDIPLLLALANNTIDLNPQAEKNFLQNLVQSSRLNYENAIKNQKCNINLNVGDNFDNTQQKYVQSVIDEMKQGKLDDFFKSNTWCNGDYNVSIHKDIEGIDAGAYTKDGSNIYIVNSNYYNNPYNKEVFKALIVHELDHALGFRQGSGNRIVLRNKGEAFATFLQNLYYYGDNLNIMKNPSKDMLTLDKCILYDQNTKEKKDDNIQSSKIKKQDSKENKDIGVLYDTGHYDIYNLTTAGNIDGYYNPNVNSDQRYYMYDVSASILYNIVKNVDNDFLKKFRYFASNVQPSLNTFRYNIPDSFNIESYLLDKFIQFNYNEQDYNKIKSYMPFVTAQSGNFGFSNYIYTSTVYGPVHIYFDHYYQNSLDPYKEDFKTSEIQKMQDSIEVNGHRNINKSCSSTKCSLPDIQGGEIITYDITTPSVFGSEGIDTTSDYFCFQKIFSKNLFNGKISYGLNYSPEKYLLGKDYYDLSKQCRGSAPEDIDFTYQMIEQFKTNGNLTKKITTTCLENAGKCFQRYL